ncbi:hypothetical protein MJN54_36405, partial [Salmonella enterica subsp. enterica serovar Kentucky]|nr:hypothetical protein [Salmonella enterica subsp. enterica serovar Kentucky]
LLLLPVLVIVLFRIFLRLAECAVVLMGKIRFQLANFRQQRGEQVADDSGYDLGHGAGFYLNATQPPWASHYRMYDYLRDEL